MPKQEKTLGLILHEIETLALSLREDYRKAKMAIVAAKRRAYKMAKLYVEATGPRFFEDFVARITPLYPNSKAPLDDWLLEQFAPLEATTGDDPGRLIAEVKEGLKLKQYLARTPGMTGSLRKSSKSSGDAAAPPQSRAVNLDEMSIEDQNRYLRNELTVYKHRARDLERELGRAKARIARMERMLKKAMA